MMLRLGVILISLSIFSHELHAEWSLAEESHTFGPEMAETDACKRAENKAKVSALGSVTGEHLSSEDLLSCSDRNDEAACTMQRHTWSMIDGNIKSVRNRTSKTIDVGNGYRQCSVSLEADIVVGTGKSDPSFDLGILLNQQAFRSGDKISLELRPTQKMYISVFQWSPYNKQGSRVIRIFPNRYEPNSQFSTPFTIPTAEYADRYSLLTLFPKEVDSSEQAVDEFLMVVGTKNKVSFRESYSYDEFKSRLREIPRPVRRQVQTGYTILRSQ